MLFIFIFLLFLFLVFFILYIYIIDLSNVKKMERLQILTKDIETIKDLKSINFEENHGYEIWYH